MLADSTLISKTTIVRSLLDRPGQTKYSLAASLLVAPVVLERELETLERQGLLVRSELPGDDEPIFWATQDAADFGFVEPTASSS